MRTLLHGFPGKPSHPPLTDASIGTYAAAVVMLVAGALGLEEEQMAHGSLLALSFGLLLAAPTAITGLADWVRLPKQTPVRRVATIHLIAMVAATLLFAATWIAQLDGYRDDEIETLALIFGAAAMGVLTAGGFLGGALAYVYGVRVLKQPDTAMADALIPGRTPATDDVLPEPGANGPAPIRALDNRGRGEDHT
jgi:uncharacterized membrane protein